MDYLRWILLAIGIVIVVGVYFWGRSKKRENDMSPLDAANDVPSFSAQQSDDEWVDGVGPVRVAQRDNVDEVIGQLNVDDVTETESTEEVETKPPEQASQPDVESSATESDVVEDKPVDTEQTIDEPKQDEVVALYIVADRGSDLKGEQILSATIATRLEYGEMKIFHRLDDNKDIMFSMANMKEPGWFDVDNMHELKTRGITLFAQLSLVEDPVETIDELLICAHTLTTMLGGQVCDQNKQLLNEAVAKSLREKAKYFASLKHENML